MRAFCAVVVFVCGLVCSNAGELVFRFCNFVLFLSKLLESNETI